MRDCFLLSAVGLVLSVSASAQEKKPAPYPPVDANKARLVQTLSGLDGPGFDIVTSDNARHDLRRLDRGSIQGWSKDVILNIRAAAGSANRWQGHAAAVIALAWSGRSRAGLRRHRSQDQLLVHKDGTIIGSAATKARFALWPCPRTATRWPAAGEDARHSTLGNRHRQTQGHAYRAQGMGLAVAFSPDGQMLASPITPARLPVGCRRQEDPRHDADPNPEGTAAAVAGRGTHLQSRTARRWSSAPRSATFTWWARTANCCARSRGTPAR